MGTGGEPRQWLGSLLEQMHKVIGSDAVGIRLKQGSDYPYFETRGFPERFVQLEKYLCQYDKQGLPILDKDGKPALDCMCGNILQERYDPSLNFFTAQGSFWSNNTTLLLASTSPKERQARTRNRCNGSGYESVTLVPLRFGGVTYGFMQFNDKRVDYFSADMISFLETMATAVALALSRLDANKALTDSEAKYRALFDCAADAIFIVDENMRFTSVNESACTRLGYSEAEMLSMGPADIDAPDMRHRREWIKDNLAKEGQALFEMIHVAKGGRQIPVEIHARTLTIEGQSVYLGIARDISERKRSEAELRASEKQFRLLAEALPQIVWMCDPAGNNLYTNDNWTEYTGLSKEESLGKGWSRAFHDDELESLLRSWENAARNGSVFSLECRLRRTDGSYGWCLNRGVPMMEEKGTILKWFGTCTDIQTLKDKEQQLQLAKDKAEVANKTKSEFLANMSHEIRTPLNGIMGMLQLMRGSNPNVEQKEFTDIALQSSKRLLRLLSDILDLSQVESGALEIKNEAFNLVDTVNSAVHLFDPIASQKGIALEVAIDPNIPESLLGDSLRLQQILSNFLGNAFKFTEKGVVAVNVYLLPVMKPGRISVLFSVSDTGIGIPDDILALIFQPFSQAETGLTRRFQGAGLGLTICQRLVTLMDGSIAVETEEGKGTACHFSIPFERGGQKENLPIIPIETPSPGLGPLHILLAEDEDVNAFAVKQALEKSGHTVVLAETGKSCIEILAEQDFDLILMDIQMPGMDGIEATKTIRNNSMFGAKAEIPIIAITAYAMDGDKEKFLAAGMDGYIAKPVQFKELGQTIVSVMEKKR